MKIRLCSVYVDDQEKALRFYTDVLGFVKKRDISMGEARWLTVVSPEEPDVTELLLEPLGNPAAKTFQQALHDQHIPLTAFAVDDLQREHERLAARGVTFTTLPDADGPREHRRPRRHLREPDPALPDLIRSRCRRLVALRDHMGGRHDRAG